jgi:hypothetical protein
MRFSSPASFRASIAVSTPRKKLSLIWAPAPRNIAINSPVGIGLGTTLLIVWLKDSFSRCTVLSRPYASTSMVIVFVAIYQIPVYMHVHIPDRQMDDKRFAGAPEKR